MNHHSDTPEASLEAFRPTFREEVPIERPCLRCDRKFLTVKAVRLCPTCTQRTSARSTRGMSPEGTRPAGRMTELYPDERRESVVATQSPEYGDKLRSVVGDFLHWKPGDLAILLNKREVTTPRGKKFTGPAVVRILKAYGLETESADGGTDEGEDIPVSGINDAPPRSPRKAKKRALGSASSPLPELIHAILFDESMDDSKKVRMMKAYVED